VPLEVVQRLLGHRHVSTTLHYTAIADEEVRDTYDNAMNHRTDANDK
jgi:site-specific recombinase XerD